MKLLQRFAIATLALSIGSFALVGCESDSSGSKDKAESVEAKEAENKDNKEGATAKTNDNEDNPLAGAPVKAKVGETAPNFTLTDTAGNEHTLADVVGEKMVVLEWTSPKCPYVRRHYKAKTMQKTLEELGGSEKVAWFAINSNKGEAEASKKWKKKQGFDFPVLIDEGGEVGKTYRAKTTPHMYVIDKEGELRYEGAIDNDPRGNKKDENVTNYVLQAGKAIQNGKSIDKKTTDEYGCSVKYEG